MVVDEQFGINLVEFMVHTRVSPQKKMMGSLLFRVKAVGAIPLAHISGPLMDIVVPFEGPPAG